MRNPFGGHRARGMFKRRKRREVETGIASHPIFHYRRV